MANRKIKLKNCNFNSAYGYVSFSFEAVEDAQYVMKKFKKLMEKNGVLTIVDVLNTIFQSGSTKNLDFFKKRGWKTMEGIQLIWHAPGSEVATIQFPRATNIIFEEEKEN